ncbi:MAG TPA: glycine zipper domain-containing protein [Tepidisphaeraceae bacterium]|nr:glycine zipper domain-containing protein [Tepidisphaeraceae bacterium]
MCSKAMVAAVLMGSLALGPMLGCESLPGDEKSQGAVMGGLGGALAGAAVAGDDDRAVGALIGAVVGAGGGYVIGAKVEEKNEKDAERRREEGLRASKNAEANPVSAEAAANAKTADVNSDGFVTLDEVVAMEEAGLSDQDMIRRLQRTQQYFALNDEQEAYLRERGVNDAVIVAMRDMNRQLSDARLASDEVDGSKPVGRNAR